MLFRIAPAPSTARFQAVGSGDAEIRSEPANDLAADLGEYFGAAQVDVEQREFGEAELPLSFGQTVDQPEAFARRRRR